MYRIILLLIGQAILARPAQAQVTYPYPLHDFTVTAENKPCRMAYMDIRSSSPNGRTVLLLHGKNFNGYYWKEVIPALTERGYRVIVPDQLGWGRSDKPFLQYSFHMLAQCNKSLLDSLGIDRVTIIAHSMGGMLAIRYSLLFPANVEKLILENPIGLEDYKTFVPYQPFGKLYKKERAATYESYRKYQQSYYPVWKPEYEQYVKAQAEALSDPAFDQIAGVNALTYQMILEQPVVYELNRLAVPVLLIIGQADRTVVGKDLLTEDDKAKHGQYPVLGQNAHRQIKNSVLIPLKGIGHIPHVQDLAQFKKAVFSFL